MEHLPYGYRGVAIVLEVLRQGRVIPRERSPVRGFQVVESRRVWSSARQEGDTTRRTERLL